jgi:queuine tRNA-ribosyltransferase
VRYLDGLPDFPFELSARDGNARAVKAISPERLVVAGAQIILANTYHLALRPGSDVVRRLGGLHSFMQWDGPILTDSGGYQVFSLRDTARIDDSGVSFRSIYDGSKHMFTPERAIAEQQSLGSDFIMCFDECPPGTASLGEVREAVERTGRWAARCKRAHQDAGGLGTDGPQMLLGIVQGGVAPELRRMSVDQLREIGFPGYAIGGLTVGEDRQAMLETTELTAGLLPEDRLRYFMGIGDPEGLVEVIARGVDIFDCVLPTRTARMGTAFTRTGKLNMRNAEHAFSTEPLEDGCPCMACRGFSRGAIRHFVMQKEILGLMLLTEHNLTFLMRLVAAARASIVEGSFASFRSTWTPAW